MPIFREILYRKLAPWIDENKPNELFADRISTVKTVDLSFTPTFKIEFPYRPFNTKTIYYSKLILSETNHLCNQVYHLIENEANLKVMKYFKNAIIDKRLTSCLVELGHVLNERQYSIDYINPKKYTFNIDEDHKTETYIMQLLKVALMWAYLEIQSFFKYLAPDELLIEEDLYIRFLFEPIPDKSFIKQVPPAIIINELSVEVEKPNQKFASSFSYIQYYSAPSKLIDLFDSLKKFNFIAQDTSLTDFKKVFSGKEISKPVVWCGNPSDLYYFIKLICYDFKLVEKERQQWALACKCFTRVNGSLFDKEKLRTLKKPQRTCSQIEQAVELLK